MKSDRRDFFKTMGAVTAAAVLAAPRAAEAAVAPPRYVPAYRHGLLLSGAVEEILGFAGGGVRGEVATNELGPNLVKKRIAKVLVEDITIAIGPNPSPELSAWINGTLSGNYLTKGGSILAADAQGNPRRQLDFSNALITEVKFPALDSLHRTPAEIEVTFSPEQIQKGAPVAMTRIATKPKAWTGANFRLSIDGLEDACARAIRIDSLSVTQTFTPNSQGGLTAGPVLVSDLTVYCPEEYADQFVDWHEDFLINGHNTDADEKGGTLEFLAPDKRTVYYTLTFSHLGIFGCALQGEDMKAPLNRLMKVELYCEVASLSVG